MAYSHGDRWSEDVILEKIKELVEFTGQKTMPTHSEMFDYFGNTKLSNAISKRQGTNYYADKLGLELKNSESNFGFEMEMFCLTEIQEKLGIPCEKTVARHPYDILVGNAVKIDVKASKLFDNYGKAKYYTFNIEKKQQTCDVFVFYCIGEDKKIKKTLVVPSYVLSGKTQFSIGNDSIYDKYINKWELIKQYHSFMSSCF